MRLPSKLALVLVALVTHLVGFRPDAHAAPDAGCPSSPYEYGADVDADASAPVAPAGLDPRCAAACLVNPPPGVVLQSCDLVDASHAACHARLPQCPEHPPVSPSRDDSHDGCGGPVCKPDEDCWG